MSATEILQTALNALSEGRLDEAREGCERVLAQEPDNAVALHWAAVISYQQGAAPDAVLGQVERAIALDGNEALYHNSRGAMLYALGRDLEAAELLKTAQARFPDDEDIDFMLRLQFSSVAPAWHIPMINDDERNQAYDVALRRAVKPGDLVLEIGTGSGLVSMMAARAGAGRVVTCEVLPLMADIAREVVAKNGLSERITVITQKSTQLRVGHDLPDKADVFVSELINIGMLAPNMLPVLQHARENLVKPDGRIIPAAAIVYGALIEAPQLARINPVRQVSGFDLSPLDKLRSPGYAQIDMAADLVRQLSQPFRALDFDFRQNMPERDAKLLQVTATSSGLVHGIAFWFDLIMDEETVYSSASTTRTNHWKQAAEFFAQPVAVQAGDRLTIIAAYDNTRILFKNSGL